MMKVWYDDSPWTDEEMDLLAIEDADALDWEGREVYQDGEQGAWIVVRSLSADFCMELEG